MKLYIIIIVRIYFICSPQIGNLLYYTNWDPPVLHVVKSCQWLPETPPIQPMSLTQAIQEIFHKNVLLK